MAKQARTTTGAKQTKADKVRKLLARPSGATLDAICKATGWQPHSARAALSGLRKAGCLIERETGTGKSGSVYRITCEPGAREPAPGSADDTPPKDASAPTAETTGSAA